MCFIQWGQGCYILKLLLRERFEIFLQIELLINNFFLDEPHYYENDHKWYIASHKWVKHKKWLTCLQVNLVKFVLKPLVIAEKNNEVI